ncbi:MAG TPA: sugar ABC transporter substrate-binding protein [Baekduia sp.]|uniref:ABC transporter substrate-binding protein n=1 Tax=Baekduia sp. TaxID=2600305 RepID=UPI002D05B4CF|nr:sugar ABC transporter substrate-binding protein [Baekduia sp.]HMJ37767.1 sugar ABC transporter substrate-binding protein [Baekduia sp.]
MRRTSTRTWSRAGCTLAVLATFGAIGAGCGSSDSGGGSSSKSKTINVAIVDNPQMKDIAKLTPSLFTAKSGIKVNYTVLDEGTLREVTTRDVAAGGKQFDVTMIGMYEAPQFGKNGQLTDLTPQATADKAYDMADLIPSVKNGLSADGKLYASPFYAESSFLMYRKDLLKNAGITMPEHPTWAQVADAAHKLNKPNMAGICLRGKPGWGDLGAALTTVLNTMGATWWSAKPDGSVDQAQVNSPAFKQALSFYVDLVKSAGEKDAANSSFNECLSQYKDGKVAMWYDATVAAGLLEASDSPVKGKNGYAFAPTDKTDSSGWLWSWALAIPKTTSKSDLAWKYVSWATGPQYIKEAGSKIDGGWAAIPPGTRKSTYAIPEYKKAASAFAPTTLDAMAAAPIDNPGTTKRPGLPGVQYVGIPEFQDVGNQCTQQFSSVIAGRTNIDSALKNCQDIASQVGQ